MVVFERAYLVAIQTELNRFSWLIIQKKDTMRHWKQQQQGLAGYVGVWGRERGGRGGEGGGRDEVEEE